MAVGASTSCPAKEFVIPEYSGVHGDVAGGYGTKSMLEAAVVRPREG